MKYDLSKLFKKAWSLHRQALKKGNANFGNALRAAWTWIRVQASNAALVEAAAQAAGVVEEYRTWASWQAVGRAVIHTSEAAFKVTVADPLTKSGTRVMSYFIYSDTQIAPIA